MPEDYICPLTKEMYIEPVMAEDGHTYEKKALQERFARGEMTSPVTKEEMTSGAMIPNKRLKTQIDAYISSQQ